MHVALTIAGSDPTSGAGIQADLKTFSAHDVYGATVIAAVTAQNGNGVYAVHDVPAENIIAQLQAVFDEFDIRAAKTGMLSNADIVHAVAEFLGAQKRMPIVVDPIMKSSAGMASLNSDDAISIMRKELFPLATLVTPNIDEAVKLSGMSIQSVADMHAAAEHIFDTGCKAVLIKGGHLEGDAIDVLFDGTTIREFRSPRVEGFDVHGTGCALSAAITANLASDMQLLDAVSSAKAFVAKQIAEAMDLGGARRMMRHRLAL